MHPRDDDWDDDTLDEPLDPGLFDDWDAIAPEEPDEERFPGDASHFDDDWD